MKIEISIEPYNLGGTTMKLSYVIKIGDELFCFDELIENAWFEDKSIFRRIVEDASFKLQKLYQDKNYNKI